MKTENRFFAYIRSVRVMAKRQNRELVIISLEGGVWGISDCKGNCFSDTERSFIGYVTGKIGQGDMQARKTRLRHARQHRAEYGKPLLP